MHHMPTYLGYLLRLHIVKLKTPYLETPHRSPRPPRRPRGATQAEPPVAAAPVPLPPPASDPVRPRLRPPSRWQGERESIL
jgi:hypothetical protein